MVVIGLTKVPIETTKVFMIILMEAKEKPLEAREKGMEAKRIRMEDIERGMDDIETAMVTEGLGKEAR
jgi:hypothetical protein